MSASESCRQALKGCLACSGNGRKRSLLWGSGCVSDAGPAMLTGAWGAGQPAVDLNTTFTADQAAGYKQTDSNSKVCHGTRPLWQESSESAVHRPGLGSVCENSEPDATNVQFCMADAGQSWGRPLVHFCGRLFRRRLRNRHSAARIRGLRRPHHSRVWRRPRSRAQRPAAALRP